MHDRLNLEQSEYQIPHKVSDLWLPNCKKWNENKIIALFGQQTLQVLLQIPLMVGDEPDICVGSQPLMAYARLKVPTRC